MRARFANSELGFAPAVVAGVALVALLVRDPYWMGVVTTLAVTCVAVLGLDLLFGWAGQLSLASGPLFVMGGYIQAILTATYSVPAGLALLATSAAVILISVGLGAMALRVTGFVYAILTVFVALLLPAFLISFPAVTGGGDGLPVAPLEVGGISISTPEQLLLAALGVLAVAYVVHVLFLSGKWGIRWRSLAASPVAHELSGNSSSYALIVAFGASALFVGLAGAIQAHYNGFMSPDAANLQFAVAVLLAAILGGLGSYLGAILGTAVVFGLPYVLATAGNLQEAIYAGAVLAVIAIFPGGLVSVVGIARRALDRLSGGRRSRWWALLAPAHERVTSRPLEPPDPGRLEAALQTSARPPGAAEVLRADGLRKAFAEVVALEDCTLALRPGSVVGIVGPNGSGKSTLLNAISGIVATEAGTIELGSRDLTDAPVHRRAKLGIARTLQVPALPERLVVWQVVALACARGSSVRTAKRRSLELLRLLGLEHIAGQRVRNLPHAQRRFVNLAQALAPRPRFLLLDEPVAGVTEEEAEILGGILRAVARAGIGVAVVEHHLDWIGALADEIIVMQSGALVAVGPPEQVAPVVDEVVRRAVGPSPAVAPSHAPTPIRSAPAAGGAPILAVERLTAGYAGRPVIDGLTLRVPERSIVGIVGPNGAGKTTILHAIAGLLPASGTITLNGAAIAGLAADARTRRGLVLAGEGRPLFRAMTVRENLELALVVQRFSRAERAARTEQVLDYFGALANRLDVAAGNLSGGQQQMLLLACCFAKRPRVLLIDEPTLGLAESVSEEVWSTLLGLCNEESGLSVLIADEEAERVTRSAELVYAIEQGRVDRWSAGGGAGFEPVGEQGGD